MAHYKVNSINPRNFSLILDNEKVGDLVYKKWYSFDAELPMDGD